MEILLEHVSVGCNQTPHCVDWNASGLLAYGADKSIALAAECCVRYFCTVDFHHLVCTQVILALSRISLTAQGVRSSCARDTVPGTIPPQPTHTYTLPGWWWSGASFCDSSWAQGEGELCTMDPSKGMPTSISGGELRAHLRGCGLLRHCLAAKSC